jgi:hypothetical protein
MRNLSKNVKVIQVLGYFAAGQTTRDSDIVDMAGYDGVMFVLGIGASSVATGVATLTAQSNSLNQTTGMAAISGSAAAGTIPATPAKATIIVDVYRPQQEFVRGEVTIATANVELLGMVAILYNSDKKPCPLDASNLAASLVAN